MAGYANFIKKKKYYDTLVDKPDSDLRTNTWYSKGLKIKSIYKRSNPFVSFIKY
jgi:hypothetical protein